MAEFPVLSFIPIEFPKVNRVTFVIDDGTIERWNVDVELSLQDDGRTLKVFVKKHIDG